jgi:hypothetical protein
MRLRADGIRHYLSARMRRLRAGMKRLAAGRDRKATFYLAFLYFLWSIVPHFHLLIHSHGGGAHAHAELSGAQVRLANRVLEGLGPAGLQGSADGDQGGLETGARSVARGPGEPALAAGPGHDWHAHYWEDANLAGQASLPAWASLAAALLAFLAARYRAPALGPTGPASARGPPFALLS